MGAPPWPAKAARGAGGPGCSLLGLAPTPHAGGRAWPARISLMRVWYPTCRCRASRLSRCNTRGSRRIAINWRGAVPIGGRPTRRITRNCSSVASGMSEESTLRALAVESPLFLAGLPRADDADDLLIVPPPHGIGDNQHTACHRLPDAKEPRLLEGDLVLEQARRSLRAIPLEHALSIYETTHQESGACEAGAAPGRDPSRLGRRLRASAA